MLEVNNKAWNAIWKVKDELNDSVVPDTTSQYDEKIINAVQMAHFHLIPWWQIIKDTGYESMGEHGAKESHWWLPINIVLTRSSNIIIGLHH